MNQSPYNVLQILDQNEAVSLAYVDDTSNPPTLHIHIIPGYIPTEVAIPKSLAHLPIKYHLGPPLTPLYCTPTHISYAPDHVACQNEPIQLGTQLQPAGAHWVGTAGAPVKWLAPDNSPHWGILSNWHVMDFGKHPIGHPQHQPTDSAPPCAHLSHRVAVNPDEPNYADAAVADALVDGKHTISDQILEIGRPAQEIVDARPGLQVKKSGRTTGLTQAVCTATGAAARVSYGDFVALFLDQDVFTDTDVHFSAPGDSGSAILTVSTSAFTSLLFAGGGDLTIGNPMRYIKAAFHLQFPFA